VRAEVTSAERKFRLAASALTSKIVVVTARHARRFQNSTWESRVFDLLYGCGCLTPAYGCRAERRASEQALLEFPCGCRRSGVLLVKCGSCDNSKGLVLVGAFPRFRDPHRVEWRWLIVRHL